MRNERPERLVPVEVASMEPERRERKVVEERRDLNADEGGSMVGYAAIKYAAIVIIVLAILYFLAVYVVPLLSRR